MKTSENKNSSSNQKEHSKNSQPIDSKQKSKVENDGKDSWKNPDPTNPKRSPEKVNEPYARPKGETSNEDPHGKTTGNYTDSNRNSYNTPNPKERVTNQGNTEKHSPVNKSDQQR